MKFQKKKDLKLRKAFSKYEMKQIFSKYLFIQRGKSSELGENFICASGGVADTFDTQTLPKSQKRKIEEKVLSPLWQERLTECHKIPRQSSKVRVKSRCLRTNRSRSINQLLRISRQECRRLALDGQIPGLTRSTW